MPLSKKHFRDPIHGFIEVSGCALKIIDSPYFQRLRRIKQLGFTDFIFHGAEHSRFGHSLGVYHLAKQLSNSMLRQHEEKIREEFCLAALLHDIGHHPFSHAFESVLRSSQDSDMDYKHENYTVSIIEDTVVGEYIEEAGFNKRNVIDLIKGQYIDDPALAYLNSLISSELDLDRLDYLQRDAYYCGVPYGEIDIDRIILCLEPENGEIVVDEKAMSAVEMYIMARFYMYTQVYMHHTRRAFDIMLKSIFQETSPSELNYPRPKKGDIERIIGFDDSWLRHQIEHISQNGKGLKQILATNILNRDPIRWVVMKSSYAEAREEIEKETNTKTTTIETESEAEEEHSYSDPDYLKVANLVEEKESLAERAKISCERIFFDTPLQEILTSSRYVPYSASTDRDVIKVKYAGTTTEIASNRSSLAYYLAKCTAQMCRVYTLNEHRAQVADAISSKYPDLKQYVWKPPT